MSWDKEYYSGVGKKTRVLGTRSGTSSKSSFPPSYFSSINGVSSSLNKMSLNGANLDTSGFNINLSAKKRAKPRRSMLGRRTKILSQNNDGDSSNNMRPLYSSSPKDEMEKQHFSISQINKNKLSPSHPFEDLNSSSFFETGQSSNFSTWSIFKKGKIHRPPRTPEKSKVLVQSEVPKKTNIFELDNSLGTIPLDSLSPKVKTEKVNTLSAYKNKKLSVVKEETETAPVIINKPEVLLEEPKNLSELIQSWFIAKQKWDESKKQLEKNTQKWDESRKHLEKNTEKMNKLNEQINQILKSQTDELSNTIVPNEISSDTENENPTQHSASENNDLVDTIYGEFKSSYSLLQTPSALSSIKKKPINALCYTPKSLSSCVKQQIKLIYGNDD